MLSPTGEFAWSLVTSRKSHVSPGMAEKTEIQVAAEAVLILSPHSTHPMVDPEPRTLMEPRSQSMYLKVNWPE